MSSKEQREELSRKYEEEKKNRIYLTKEEVEALTPEEIEEAKVRGAMLGFFEALIDGKTEEAYMCIGVLRNAGVPDLPYYYGALKQYKEDYDGALEEYKKIGAESEKYIFASQNIERIYELTGKYEELSKILTADNQQTDIAKFEKRMMCIMYAKDRSVEELTNLISKYPFEEISDINQDDEDEVEIHCRVCKMICNCLVAAGTCINDIVTYVKRMNGKAIDYENDQNIQVYISAYKRTIMMLKAMNSYKAIKIQAKDGPCTFDRIALASNSWEEKFQILTSGQYQAMLGGLIAQILNPNRFPAADRIALIYSLLDVIGTINPVYIQQVLSLYWDDIESAIKGGDLFSAGYIKSAHGFIVATGHDYHNLKTRLAELIKSIPEIDPSDSVKWSRIVYSLTREGYEAFIHAENQYKLNEPKKGTENASELALMYFKVFEIEYNRRLIRPLIKELDIDHLEELKDPEDDIWTPEIENIQKVIRAKGTNNEKMMIGEIRTLLNKIWEKDGRCSNIFANALYKVLTDAGIQAFQSKRMMQLISFGKTDQYRNPGAHTGYIPFTTASEARNYVTHNIPVMGKWFK